MMSTSFFLGREKLIVYSFDDPPADMPGERPFCGFRKLAVVEFD